MIRRSRALALMAAAAAAPLAARRASAQATTTVRFGTVPTETNGQLFYGTDTGMFKRAGIDVDVTYSNNLSVTMAALISGSIDVTSIDIIAFANAINRGAPLAIIAGGALYQSSNAATLLCVAKTGAIRSAKDLEGHAVGVIKLGGLSYASVRAWLAQNGADLTRIQFFELPSPQMTAALQRGTIAAAVFIEPELHTAKNDVRTLGKPYDAIAKELLVNVWVARRAWLGEAADVPKRVVGALYAASSWANAHQDDSLAILAKYAHLDLTALHGMTRERYATTVRSAWLQPVLDVALQYNIIEHGIDLASVTASV